jgi:amidophosphoribosyltransferase
MCGIVGIVGGEEIVEPLIQALIPLYKRGQEGSGLGIEIDQDTMHVMKVDGPPNQLLNLAVAENLESKISPGKRRIGVAHVRYGTAGGPYYGKQPLVEDGFLLVHNGNCYDYNKLLEEITKRHIPLEPRLHSDSELVAKLVKTSNAPTFSKRFIETIDFITPTHAFIAVHNEKLHVYLDPTGNRPLKMGNINGTDWMVASEETPLLLANAKNIQNVPIGQYLVLEPGVKHYMQLYEPWLNHCDVEEIYLALADRFLREEGIDPKLWKDYPLVLQRINAGIQCAKQNTPEKKGIVIYAPESGYWYAVGFSKETNFPLSTTAIVDLVGRRTFIEPTQKMREEAAEKKPGFNRDELENNIVYVVEDSSIRGTFLWSLIKGARVKGGVREMHVRVASSRVCSPCHYGMNFQTEDELLAHDLNEEQVEQYFRARFFGYDDDPNLLKKLIIANVGLNTIVKEYKNYIRKEENRKKVCLADDLNPNRFSHIYLSLGNMNLGYGRNPDEYCQACFTGIHRIQGWYKVRDEKRVKNRVWKSKRTAN